MSILTFWYNGAHTKLQINFCLVCDPVQLHTKVICLFISLFLREKKRFSSGSLDLAPERKHERISMSPSNVGTYEETNLPGLTLK